MAPIIFRFRSCGHVENDPKPHELWKRLQERTALPQALTVETGLPCRSCSESQVAYYSDISVWLHKACTSENHHHHRDSTGTSSSLAELIWVRSALEQQHPEIPDAKSMCALLALAARGLRELHVGALEAVLLGPFAHGRNMLQLYLLDGGVSSTEPELNAFYVAQAERFGRIAGLVDRIAATHAPLCPANPPHLGAAAKPEVLAYFRRRVERSTAALEAHSDDLVERATRLADSLPIRRAVNGAVVGMAVSPGDEQVRLVKGMERVVDDMVGLVVTLREVVARAETSPLGLREYCASECEVAPRRIFGLF